MCKRKVCAGLADVMWTRSACPVCLVMVGQDQVYERASIRKQSGHKSRRFSAATLFLWVQYVYRLSCKQKINL